MNYNINTEQKHCYKNLATVVLKHNRTVYKPVISIQQRQVFAEASRWLAERSQPIILDSGCGRGMSSHFLAKKFPSHSIIALDKSSHRLSHCTDSCPDNLLFVQANCEDFWYLAVEENWLIDRHYILYPNPWPKAKHFKRRFHGHPIFPRVLKLGGEIILRSNWRIYLEEFRQAAQLLGVNQSSLCHYRGQQAITHFEQKYWDTQTPTYECRLNCSIIGHHEEEAPL